MKIIGHRGAAGLAPENTIKAINAGVKAGADAVEFDVRRTKDGVFVLSHDATLIRLAGIESRVRNLTLKELKTVKFFSGEPIATLEEALQARLNATAVIEGKGKDWGNPLASFLRQHAVNNFRIISFNHAELGVFLESMPEARCYALERKYALRAILLAHRMGLYGVNFNFWIMNPFSYCLARLYRLDAAIYTVNQPFLMRWFTLLYPKVAIATNRPDILSKIKK